jgi:hypothetical protein
MAPAERDSETVSVSPVPHDACVCVCSVVLSPFGTISMLAPWLQLLCYMFSTTMSVVSSVTRIVD